MDGTFLFRTEPTERTRRGAYEFTCAMSIAFAENGDAYIVDNGDDRISVFSSDGRCVRRVHAPLEMPHGIVCRRDKQLLFVTDSDHARVCGLQYDGRLVREWGGIGDREGKIYTPESLALNPVTGELAVSDFGNSRVQVTYE